MSSHGSHDRPAQPATLVDLLQRRSQESANQPAYWYVDADTKTTLTYLQLHERAQAIASVIRQSADVGDRCVLAYPAGPDFIAALFGCFYAGVVAIPSPLPSRRNRRLGSIVIDSKASCVAARGDARQAISSLLEESASGATMVETDQLAASSFRPSSVHADSLAMLQYTSGSTQDPRGVMLSHGNLMDNLAVICERFDMRSTDRAVTWLPHHHDMGLIGGLLEPLFVGIPTVVMPPSQFLRKPVRWMELIAEIRATVNGGPTFGYDLCARVDLDAIKQLDLSCWRLAFCGAEPIRPDVVERFLTATAHAGFERRAFYPCYGLAEATLIATGGDAGSGVRLESFDAAAIRNHATIAARDPQADKAYQLVSSGRVPPGHTLAIVDPENHDRVPEGSVGEIWLASPSVAMGYFEKPEASRQAFQATIARESQPFLRTGDLGFVRDGELFVTGRAKDLIIIHGQNHYPQDIEATVSHAHEAIEPAWCAAFAWSGGDEEQVAVVAELKRRAKDVNYNEVIAAISKAVFHSHELFTHLIALVKAGGLPKTTSGKVQRSVCQSKLEDGTLPTIALWRHAAQDNDQDSTAKKRQETAGTEREATTAEKDAAKQREQLICQLIADQLKQDVGHVEPTRGFAELGLDSVAVLAIVEELEQQGIKVDPLLFFEYSTPRQLAQFLAAEAAKSQVPETEHGNGPSGNGPSGDKQPDRNDSKKKLPTNDRPDNPGNQRVDNKQQRSSTVSPPIAIVGLACRFPCAPDRDAYWSLLSEGIDGVGTPGPRRVTPDDSHREFRPAGYLDDVDQFDPDYFGISPREAQWIDPQHRLLLEVTAEAMADAGRSAEQLGPDVGVFVGISHNEYATLPQAQASPAALHLATGNALSIAANRLSYQFNFVGPSMAIDTACSSSLVALHVATQSLQRGECSAALAAGVNLLLTTAVDDALVQGGFLSPTGRCRVFDAEANGYVRGEGCGVLVLKPLSRAMADGDSIYAIIRGSAVAQGGRSGGLTIPNPAAQRSVISASLARAEIHADQVDYVEAHGTGTALGDPIELQALADTVGGSNRTHPCLVGSVKSQIGHLEAAAGMAGVIKTALMFLHGGIPAQLHFDTPNAKIPFGKNGMSVPRQLTPWPARDEPALAGVSSFGFGGTNAHVVLEAPPTASLPARQLDRGNFPTWNRKRCWLPVSGQSAPVATISTEVTPGRNGSNGTSRPARRQRRGRADLRGYLQEVLADVAMVSVEEKHMDKPLAEFGVDSMMALEIAHEIEDAWGVSVPASLLATSPTLATIHEWLQAELRRSNGHDGQLDAVDAPSPSANEKRPMAERPPLPLTRTQQRLWLQDEFSAERSTLNICSVFHVHGRLDIIALQRALNALVHRHEALQVHVEPAGDGWQQVFGQPQPTAIRFIDLQHLPSSECLMAAKSEVAKATRQSVAAAHSPMFCATVVRLSDSEHYLALVVNHLVADGWSMSVLAEELSQLYCKSTGINSTAGLAPAPSWYDYVAGQHALREEPDQLAARAFWQQRIQGYDGRVDLPVNQNPLDAPDQGSLEFCIDRQLADRIEQLGRTTQVSPFAVLLGGLQVVLQQYTEQERFIISVPFANRYQAKWSKLVGPLFSVLPIRSQIDRAENGKELLSLVWEELAVAHTTCETAPFDVAHDGQQAGRTGRGVQVLFEYQSGMSRTMQLGELDLSVVENATSAPRDTLAFHLVGGTGEIRGRVAYCHDRLDRDLVQCLVNQLKLALAALCDDPAASLAAVDLITSTQRRCMLQEWNDTACTYAKGSTIHAAIAPHFKTHAQETAIVCDHQRCTYAELEQRIDTAARLLTDAGAKSGDLIAIQMDRSLDMVVAMLAANQLGAAYLPIDPDYPDDYRRAIAADAQFDFTITSDSRFRGPSETALQVSPGDSRRHLGRGNLDNVAYILYTSGSTGHPKGVAVTNDNVANFFAGMDHLADPHEGGTWLAVTSTAFDISVFELLWPLARGYKVVIERDPLRALVSSDPRQSLAAAFTRHDVTHFQCTPALMRAILDDPVAAEAIRRLKKLFVGGDVLPRHTARQLCRTVLGDVYNMYGPTETTIWSTAWQLDNQTSSVPIGRPIANTQVYVLDKRQRLVPVGVAGELYIAGDGVTRGYWGRSDLTEQRFVSDPFSDRPQARMYRTGDRVRWRTDGQLEFLGREDHQVKIRGHRIELGSIETTLEQHDHVRQAVALAVGDAADDRRVVAYVTLHQPLAAGHRGLKRFVRERLPGYMTPDQVIPLDQFPLTSNGKINRQALKRSYAGTRVAPDEADASGDTDPLMEVIREELGLPELGVDDFLSDIGATSLDVVRLLRRLERETGKAISLAKLARDAALGDVVNDLRADLMRHPRFTGDAEPLKTLAVSDETISDVYDEGVI